MWPLNARNIKTSITNFLTQKLNFSPEDVVGLGEVKYKKCHARPSSKVKNEFIVTFESIDARDAVRAAAFNLAGDRQSGMRLHIPGHLEPNFKALEGLSYLLKQKHATLRRNIKFDEPNMDLVLDFQVQEGDPWRSVRPAQARRYANAPRKEAAGSNDTRNCMVDDLSDILGDPPEANE